MYYFLQFKCDPKFVNKIKTSLESHQYQYHVISAEESYIPKTIIELDDSDMEAVSNIHKAVSSIEDISDIYDNLA
jgi:transcriptional/translational regulatory protein YebC/TACO1